MSLIDVVIPTFNRQARLRRTLLALANQSFQDFRVIVADDGSSPSVAGELGGDQFGLRRLDIVTGPGNAGPATARNRAVAAGSAPFIAFVDDDVDPAPEWLRAHLSVMAEGGAVASFGPLLPPAGWRPTPWNLWEARTLQREYERMEAGVYQPTWRQFFTGNALLRREDLQAVGGFDARLRRAEDIELALRLHRIGCRFAFQPGAIGWHDARRTQESWLRIPREYAEVDRLLEREHPDLAWATTVAEERASRPRAVRVLRPAAGRSMLRAAVTAGLMRLATSALAAGSERVALAACSVAYDFEYSAAYRAAAHGPVTPPRPRKPGINAASTPLT
ncbi:MAG: glycosyltransferase family 2 protein [Dehalococcoidia bacterium]